MLKTYQLGTSSVLQAVENRMDEAVELMAERMGLGETTKQAAQAAVIRLVRVPSGRNVAHLRSHRLEVQGKLYRRLLASYADAMAC